MYGLNRKGNPESVGWARGLWLGAAGRRSCACVMCRNERLLRLADGAVQCAATHASNECRFQAAVPGPEPGSNRQIKGGMSVGIIGLLVVIILVILLLRLL